MKNLKVLCFVLSLLIIALGVFTILLATGKVSFNKVNCECKTCNEEIKVDVDKLHNIKKGDLNILKSISTKYAYITLTTDGKVVLNNENNLSNITNAVNIELANSGDLYILTSDGNIYKYFTGVTKTASLEATKVEEYKDIKKMITYATHGKQSGGCDYIILIDKDNNYKTLEEFCI